MYINYIFFYKKSCINMFKFYVYASKNNLRRWRERERNVERERERDFYNVNIFEI